MKKTMTEVYKDNAFTTCKWHHAVLCVHFHVSTQMKKMKQE